jgi:hypothetical protein
MALQNVNDILNFINFELNKSQSGNTLSPSEYNTCLSWANLEYFKLRYSLPEQYAPGRPTSAITLDVTQKIIDDMRMLRTNLGGKNRPALAIDIDGWADYPTDYVHISSVTTLEGNTIEILRDDYLGDRLTNSIKMPTAENPICLLYDTYIEFHPKDLGFAKFNYIRLPQTPLWDYTIVNDQPVYKSSTSIQFEYPQDCLPDIAAMILRYASANLRDPLSIQLSEQRKDKGI